jgi:hypothetical protein
MLPTAVRQASHAHAAQHDARHDAAHMVGLVAALAAPPIRSSRRLGKEDRIRSSPRRIWGFLAGVGEFGGNA